MREDKGFVIILAVLVTSIMLAISLTVSFLVSGEIEFSSVSRDSQKAFYASDAGAECALYWDTQQKVFSTSTPLASLLPISCALNLSNQPTANPGLPTLADPYRAQNPNGVGYNTFVFRFDLANGSCAYITVDKTAMDGSVVITSRGYNTCVVGSTKRLERAMRIGY